MDPVDNCCVGDEVVDGVHICEDDVQAAGCHMVVSPGAGNQGCDDDGITDHVSVSFEDVQQSECRMVISPGATKYWIPESDNAIKPFEGQWFQTMDDAVDFYSRYAGEVGFDVRHSTMRKSRVGEIVLKYLVCSREGFKNAAVDTSLGTEGDDISESSQKRRRVSNRVGCKAKVVLKRGGQGGFVVHHFEQRHNHCLCSKLSRQFLKVNRKLHVDHQTFVANCAKANIGPVKSYRLFKEMVGRYSNVEASSVDFRNFKRDLLAYISGGDAQLVIDKFFKRQEVCSAFFFEFDLDQNDQLARIFWADPIGRKNFSRFGDAVSFDATYRTNRYNLVFVPFTGVDNHKRCITFGASLLTREDVDSYIWLLERFKRAMGHEPLCTITDQDPAMKIAVARVFPSTRHRFCMWHIMTMVGEKVGPVLSKDELFRRKLNSLVWCETLEIPTFEDRWHSLMEEYGLTDNKWFRQLFELRRFWVPSFFSDLFMGGLVRTTSRSKGENSFFGSFTNGHSSLVEFFMHYDSAIDAQRHTQAKLNADCDGFYPEYKTPLSLKRHVASVYTITLFYDVQTEICAACFLCRVVNVTELEGVLQYVVKEGDNPPVNVLLVVSDTSATCSCRLFGRVGLLRRHIFLVFKDLQLQSIPLRYVVSRWTPDACMRPIFHVEGVVVDQSAELEGIKVMVNQVWADVYSTMGMAECSMGRLVQLRRALKDQRDSFRSDGVVSTPAAGKDCVIQSFCGTLSSPTVTVLSPEQANNKGSGKRLKGFKEKADELRSKPMRVCRRCNQLGHHDSRNCPSTIP